MAGGYGWHCLQHVVTLALPDAVAGAQPDPAAVAAAVETIDQLGLAAGEEFASIYRDYAWALWTRAAFTDARGGGGSLLDVLPPAAVPHVRMAAALALMQEEATRRQTSKVNGNVVSTPDLDQLVAKLADDMESRPPVNRESKRIPVKLRRPKDYWPVDEGFLEEDLPAAYCLGASRRTVSDDDSVEHQLVILEAAGRTDPSFPLSLFIQGLDMTRAREVRWTAARIARAMFPEDGRLAALDDPDPLVHAQLRPRAAMKVGPGRGEKP